MRNLKLIYSRHNFTSPAQAITPQIAPYCELTLVLRGRLEYVVDGRQISLDEGDAVFIKTGQTRARKKHDTLCDYVSFNFETEGDINLPTHIKSAVHSEELFLIAALDKMNSRYYPDNDEKIGHLLACTLALLEDRVKMHNYSPLTRSIIAHVNKNYALRITLDDIAALTYFSPIYCDTVFKREVGRSIIDFLIDKRIEEAKKLLRENVSASAVSSMLGFESATYFTKVFKKYTTMTPTAYRKRIL
jgi:YesN/AraC family two-component response regulator